MGGGRGVAVAGAMGINVGVGVGAGVVASKFFKIPGVSQSTHSGSKGMMSAVETRLRF